MRFDAKWLGDGGRRGSLFFGFELVAHLRGRLRWIPEDEWPNR